MTTPNSLDQGKDAWRGYVVKRTEAMPKNSLFGTALEKTDPKLLEFIDNKAYQDDVMKERKEKANQYDHKLPDSMRNISGKRTQYVIIFVN